MYSVHYTFVRELFHVWSSNNGVAFFPLEQGLTTLQVGGARDHKIAALHNGMDDNNRLKTGTGHPSSGG
jgi:hypothetical protein